MKYTKYQQVLPKIIWEQSIATPRGRECTPPLHVLAVLCPLQTSSFTQLCIRYIHTTSVRWNIGS